MRSVVRRIAVAVALGGVLVLPFRVTAGPLVVGAAPAPIASSATGPGLLGSLWSWLRAIWAAAPGGGHQRPAEGCGMEPNGGCLSPSPGPTAPGAGS